MKLTHLNPSELPDWSSLFSQVVIAEGSPLRVIAVSGQVGVDRSQALSGDGSFAAQLDGAFKNLLVALSAARCSVAEVVKLTIYVVGYSYDKADIIRETVRGHFGSRPLPAYSLIGVEALARPELQIEVEALAIAEGYGDTGMMFAIKAELSDPWAETFAFSAQKTMYGGKHIAKGDTIFVFASENEGGPGLIASGVVTSAKAIAKKRGIARQTPRVSIAIRRTALAKRRLGRSELKLFSDWNDGRPETELNFKFYRQATNKIVGISDEAATFLRGFF